MLSIGEGLFFTYAVCQIKKIQKKAVYLAVFCKCNIFIYVIKELSSTKKQKCCFSITLAHTIVQNGSI
jgi:hypothetical protein